MFKRHFKGWILTALISILVLVGVGNSELYINGIKTLGSIVIDGTLYVSGTARFGTDTGAGQVNITPASAIDGLAITMGANAARGIYVTNTDATHTTPLVFIDQNETAGAAAYALHVDSENAAGPAVFADGTATGGDLRLGSSVITVGSGAGITVNQPGNANSQLYKVTTTYAAYTDADTTKGIVIATLPAKTKIVGFYADTTAAYTGGITNAATLVVGITAESAAEIIASHNVFAGAILAGDADAEMGTSITRAAAIQGGYMPSWTGTTAIYATLVIVNDILSNLTAGSTTFYIQTERY